MTSHHTSHQLLLVVEAIPLDGGDLHFMLLDDYLQLPVQLLLLLLEELLLLSGCQSERGEKKENIKK